MAKIEKYSEFCYAGKEAVDLINKLAAYALENNDREG